MSHLLIPQDPDRLLAVVSTFFFAALVKGATGLGFSTICLPFLVTAIGLRETLPLLIVPSLSSNLMVMVEAGHFFSTLGRFWPLFASALPGIAVGLALLAWVDPRLAAAVLGIVLIAYCLFALARPEMRLPARLERPLGPPVGIVTGVINGLTGAQVMPVLPYLLVLRLGPGQFVQAINCWGTLSSLVMAVGLSKLGFMTWETFLVSAAGLVPVYVGVKLGIRVRRWFSPDGFRRAVLVLLIFMGVSLVGRYFL